MKCINDIIQYPVFYEMFDNEKLKYLNNQKSSIVLICTYPCTDSASLTTTCNIQFGKKQQNKILNAKIKGTLTIRTNHIKLKLKYI